MIKLTTLEERFLNSYFQIDILIGNFVSDKEKEFLFEELSKIYLIPEKRRAELLCLCESDKIKALRTETDYNLYKRLESFKRISLAPTEQTTENYLADVKGRAINALKQLEYSAVLYSTKPSTFSFLTNSSQCGMILAMRILGLLQFYGVFTARDETAGKKLLTKCAKWNDSDGILALLHIDADNRAEAISMLYSVSDGTPFESLFETARDFYGFESVPKNRETDLIERAIGLDIVKAQIYSPQVCRIVYSRVLSENDKLKLVLNNKGLLCEANDLPIGLKKIKLEAPSKTPQTVILSEEQTEDVIQSILYASEANSLTPCVVTGDSFLASDAVNAIKHAFSDANVVEINASTLMASDFNPDKNHVLIRSLSENKKNILLIVLNKYVDHVTTELLSRFFEEANRRTFRLSVPSITLDLSDVLPVCVCDTSALKSIKHLCDCIELKSIEREDALKGIDRLIEIKCREYGIEKAVIEDEARLALIERLSSFSDTAITLDKIIYSIKGRGSDSLITLERVEKLLEARITKLGF